MGMALGKLEITKDFDGLLKGDRGIVYLIPNSQGRCRVHFPQTGYGIYDLDVGILKYCKPISGAIAKLASEVLKSHE
jgi:hypothetical protein